jgi:hypothetical protein
MKRVVQRCPNCGVEYDEPIAGACDVCGTEVRYWCRVHGAEIGFMDTAACPRCAAEAARPAPPPRRPAGPPPPLQPRSPRGAPVETVETDSPWTEPDPRVVRPRWGGREPRVVIREGAEDLAPYAAAGANFAVRLMLALFAVVRSVLGLGILGVVIGFIYASSVQGLEPLWTAAFGAMVGGGVGLLVGAIRALRILFAPPPER